jgi:hypothetical protein
MQMLGGAGDVSKYYKEDERLDERNGATYTCFVAKAGWKPRAQSPS